MNPQSYIEPENLRRVTQGVVERIERIPPETFLAGAALSLGTSLMLRLLGRHSDAQFVGQWVPTLLLVGLYAKVPSITQEWSGTSERPEPAGSKAMH
jgi:hypothetical protein